MIITHHLPLEEAARGYEVFNEAQEDRRKVVLTPGRGSATTGLAAVAAY